MANVYSNYSLNLQDLEKSVIIDDGQGNPVVYVTTTRQVPTRWSVGAFDNVSTSDVVVNVTAPSFVLYALTGDASDDIVDIVTAINVNTEQQAGGVFDSVGHTEVVSLLPSGWNPVVFDAVGTSENLGNEPGGLSPALLFEAVPIDDTTGTVIQLQ